MAGKAHPLGHCTCKKRNPRHWTADEVDYLERSYGRLTDAAIAKHLGRSLDGVDVKADRLGLRKSDAGWSARKVADIFGVDSKLVARWIGLGLLAGHKGLRYGVNKVWLVHPPAVETFIRRHPEYVDVAKMPESWYRDLAARDRWYTLPEVERLTGHDPKALTVSLRNGVYRARKRFGWWVVPEGELPRIAKWTTRWRREHLDEVQRERSRQLRERKLRRVREAA